VLGRWLMPNAITAAAENTVTQVAPSPPPPGAAIDTAAVDKIRVIGGSPLLGRVIARFAETSPPLVATMREACAAGDTEAVWRAAHTLKSSAAAVGAGSLAQRCAYIEAMAREDRILPPNSVIGAVGDELGVAIDALRKLTENEVRVA
jgi:two-component system, sensor histidine kinase and response regulator